MKAIEDNLALVIEPMSTRAGQAAAGQGKHKHGQQQQQQQVAVAQQRFVINPAAVPAASGRIQQQLTSLEMAYCRQAQDSTLGKYVYRGSLLAALFLLLR